MLYSEDIEGDEHKFLRLSAEHSKRNLILLAASSLCGASISFFILKSPIHWLAIHSGIEESTWSSVGVSFSQIATAIFIPFIISSKLNEYMAFRQSGELNSLRLKMKETVEDLEKYNDSLQDEVSKTIMNEYSSLLNRAKSISKSVKRILPTARIIIFLGFVLNIYIICYGWSERLGPVALWPLILIPFAHYFAEIRFMELTIKRMQLEFEFKRKDSDYRKHLYSKILPRQK